MAAARSLAIADDPAAWAALGFAVDAAGAIALGPVSLRLVGPEAGEGIVALELDGAVAGAPGGAVEGAADGLVLRPAPAGVAGGAEHPNGAVAVDHVVALTPDCDRTADALAAAGGDVRRRGGPPELPAPMAFVRFGPLIVEVAARKGTVPFLARWWGLTVTVADLDVAAAIVGVEPRDAVQPGRRILTVPGSAGLSTAVALMSPRP